MNTIRSIATCSPHRLPARLKLISTRLGSLLLLFQRMPVVQFLFPEANIIGGASVANTISLAVTTVVGLGAYDSVAGATTIDGVQPLAVTGATTNAPSEANSINVPATVSAALNFVFKCDNAESEPESWKIVSGTLPTGLSMLRNESVPLGVLDNTITGTPVPVGKHSVDIRVYRYASFAGASWTQRFNIYVLGFTTQPVASTTINSGETTTLTCVATGVPVATSKHPAVPVVKYEWFQGAPPSETTPVGTNSPSFTTPSNLAASTSYWVKVTSTLSGYAVSAKSSTAVVNVNPASSPFDTWVSVLPVDQRGATQTPQNDGVTNLMKYACNLNPLAPDVSKLTVGGSETKGLPVQSIVGGKLRMEFLRRKASPNPGITYFVEFSSDMGGASWSSQDVSTSPAGSPVGTDWERVEVTDPTGGTARFGRVKVVKSP
jgi:hypothetical protein